MGHWTTRLPNNNLTVAGWQGKNLRLVCAADRHGQTVPANRQRGTGMANQECSHLWLTSCVPVSRPATAKPLGSDAPGPWAPQHQQARRRRKRDKRGRLGNGGDNVARDIDRSLRIGIAAPSLYRGA